MKEVCDYSHCTGCAACVNACPQRCIILEPDEHGELHPVVDHANCVNCGACQKACPENNAQVRRSPIRCFAAWRKDSAKKKLSASGGVAAVITETIINEKHGVAYGTAYDAEMFPRVMRAADLVTAERFKGSKYVQSVVGPELYRDVRDDVVSGRQVVFIGTPCQVAGLKGYLGRDYDNLLTVDLICHGVCPTSYFIEEVGALKAQYHIPEVSDVRFRGNDDADYKDNWRDKLFGRSPKTNYAVTVWTGESGSRRMVYSGDQWHNFYLAGFLKSISLRGNCYTCRYAQPERVGDLTIGDFIGLGKREAFPYGKHGVSFVSANTDKGLACVQELVAAGALVVVERSYAERLEYAPGLRSPSAPHSARQVFRARYLQVGFKKALAGVLGPEFAARRRRRLLKFLQTLPSRLWKRLWKGVG